MHECTCGNEISDGRWNLGYRVCLECGEAEAQKVADKRKTQCAPLFNKGPVQPITSIDQVKDLGRK